MGLAPIAIPVTMPLEAPTVAIEVIPLTHVPPGGEGVNVILLPVQTEDAPLIVGNALTVTTVVAVPQLLV